MTPIKVILIILLVLVLRTFLVQKSMLLPKRFLALIVFLVLVFLVIFPDFSTKVANFIGVGRGVDLIFYLSHLFLLLLIVTLWRKINLQNNIITKLARQISIQKPVKQKDAN